jgi:hypothetical protein
VNLGTFGGPPTPSPEVVARARFARVFEGNGSTRPPAANGKEFARRIKMR